jgi:hypothetical protein
LSSTPAPTDWNEQRCEEARLTLSWSSAGVDLDASNLSNFSRGGSVVVEVGAVTGAGGAAEAVVVGADAVDMIAM